LARAILGPPLLHQGRCQGKLFLGDFQSCPSTPAILAEDGAILGF
jgi:hypothetical protein